MSDPNTTGAQGAAPGPQAFHPQSPVARLAEMGLIAHVRIAPPGIPVAGGGGGGPQVGGPAADGTGMALETLLANLGASLTLAALTLGSGGTGAVEAQGVTAAAPHHPPFQVRAFSLALNAHVDWTPEGNLILRSVTPGSTGPANSPSQITIAFEPLPLLPARVP